MTTESALRECKYTMACLDGCDRLSKELEGDASGGRIWPGMRIPTLRTSGPRTSYSYSCRGASAHAAGAFFLSIVLSKARFSDRARWARDHRRLERLLLAFHFGDASPGRPVSARRMFVAPAQSPRVDIPTSSHTTKSR